MIRGHIFGTVRFEGTLSCRHEGAAADCASGCDRSGDTRWHPARRQSAQSTMRAPTVAIDARAATVAACRRVPRRGACASAARTRAVPSARASSDAAEHEPCAAPTPLHRPSLVTEGTGRLQAARPPEGRADGAGARRGGVAGVRRGRAGLRVLFETGKFADFIASVFMPLALWTQGLVLAGSCAAVRVPF